MIWREHSRLRGSHAFLSPSNPAWLRYDKEKIITARQAEYAKKIGTIIHELASQMIDYRLRVSRRDKNLIFHACMSKGIPKREIDIERYIATFVPYVNDAIFYNLTTEQVLYFSDACYGTADAISFDEKRSFLRIHDLKTGMTPAHMEQLEIYAALFCLEYDVSPVDIEMELRIYQNGDVVVEKPEVNDIFPIIDKIRTDEEFILEYEGADHV